MGCGGQMQDGPLACPRWEASAVDLLPGMSDRIEGADAHRRPSHAANDPGYRSRRPMFFNPSQIILSKGSFADSQRRELVDAVCALYPHAEVSERFDLPHNRIDLGTRDPMTLHYRGKETLVFGEHRSAVRVSQERGNMCPNYWHFSPYGFCPYDCKYCYLAATPGVRFSPSVKIFLNLGEILKDIDRIASRIGEPTAFYLGKLQDGLALDPLTGYSRTLVPFFAKHACARLTLLTKAIDVENLLDLDHRGHTILSWSLNPKEVCAEFEANTPPLSVRISAMRQCAEAGYPVRAVIMPIIPVAGWREIYTRFLRELLAQVRLARITLGGICSYDGALSFTESKLGKDNTVTSFLRKAGHRCPDGRNRYEPAQRIEIYRHLITSTRSLQNDLPISLCLEEPTVFEELGLTASAGRCNCVL